MAHLGTYPLEPVPIVTTSKKYIAFSICNHPINMVFLKLNELALWIHFICMRLEGVKDLRRIAPKEVMKTPKRVMK